LNCRAKLQNISAWTEQRIAKDQIKYYWLKDCMNKENSVRMMDAFVDKADIFVSIPLKPEHPTKIHFIFHLFYMLFDHRLDQLLAPGFGRVKIV
jgi:hypothetical protein